MATILIGLMLLLSLICLVIMAYKFKSVPQEAIGRRRVIPLMISGVLAYIADTIGVGSFAVNIAVCKGFKLFRDEQLPAVINGVQIIPGAIEATVFMQRVHVDIKTLVILVIATCFGGIIGGLLASRLQARLIQLIMMVSFAGVVILLLGKAFSLFPIGGEAISLVGWKLWLGFAGLFAAGILVAFGVGLFAVVEVILFLLGMSPLVAFPIMTAAGAIQKPFTTVTFALNNKIPLKPVLVISLSGIIGVFIGLAVISHLSFSALHWLLIVILLFNIFGIARSYFGYKK